MAADLQTIYRAATREEAELHLSEFAEKWDSQFPTISKSWHANWERITPFFAYPADIRRVIYTANTIESVNMSLRKIIKNRGSFPTDESALELLYLTFSDDFLHKALDTSDARAGNRPLRIRDRETVGRHAGREI